MRKTRDPSVESKINGPFVHNLPKRKPVKRKVFTFRGIQSTHGVTHHIKEQKVYNNMYPDVPTDSGLVSSFSFVALANFTCLVLRKYRSHCGKLKNDPPVSDKLQLMQSGRLRPLNES